MEKRVLISYCGLYCSNCRSYKGGKCPACRDKTDAAWCKVRACAIEKELFTCAECTDVETCKIRNNFVGKVMEFIFRSDKTLNLTVMRDRGYDFFVAEVEERGKMNLDKRKSYS